MLSYVELQNLQQQAIINEIKIKTPKTPPNVPPTTDVLS